MRRRRSKKGSMRATTKRARRGSGWEEGMKQGMGRVPLVYPHRPRPLFIRCRGGRFDIPTTDDSALSALDTDAPTDARAYTFNSLLIPRLLLLSLPRARARARCQRGGSFPPFIFPPPFPFSPSIRANALSTRRATPREMNNGRR